VLDVSAAVGLFAIATFAQSNPAVGLWKSEEPDKTTLIQTWEENGKLTAGGYWLLPKKPI